ncbi:MAG: glycosyl hydrolase family 65 protein [Azospirillaceae bacterium]
MTDGWTLVYDDFEPASQAVREALTVVGNGYVATRGALADCEADGTHYPGTYLAGGYDRLVTPIAGREVENEDLVNLPNWLAMAFRIDDGPWVTTASATVADYRASLDLAAGTLTQDLRLEDPEGRRTRVVWRRFASMHDPHVLALEMVLAPENWSGRLTVRSLLDGAVRNTGVARYSDLADRHLETLSADEPDTETVRLAVRTVQSRLEIALAARTRVRLDDDRPAPTRTEVIEADRIGQDLFLDVVAGDTVAVEKIVALHTGRDRAISEPGLAALERVRRAGDFESLLAAHRLAWSHLWRKFDIGLEIDATRPEARPDGPPAAVAPDRVVLALRLHLFHLLQTVSIHTMELDVGVPARGLHGEAYRGHIFWDELFIFPTLNLRLPDITRSLLEYRRRRLDAARANARANGLAGALFPWQSGSDGREETQLLHLNPRSGRWLSDNSWLQRHVNIAIAYNVWQYYQVSGDLDFLQYSGAEILLEIARCLASMTEWDEETGRCGIRGVMGPDEYHDAYPDAERPGLDNNAYTNVMTVWVVGRALEALDSMPADRRRDATETLGIDEAEIRRWSAITRAMHVPFDADGIILQFDGYDRLEEFDWAGYRERYGDIHRLDRILEAEGDTPNRYKVSKQADVLMLLYLLSADELTEILTRLGYDFDPASIPRIVEYYIARTSNGSTLSRVVHSWVLARADRAGSWRQFAVALASDIADIQGGTTAEGIHLGAMAGTVDLVQRAYAGIETRGDRLVLDPSLPNPLTCLKLRLRYRRHALTVRIDRETVTVAAEGAGEALDVEIAGIPCRIPPDRPLRVIYRGPEAPALHEAGSSTPA